MADLADASGRTGVGGCLALLLMVWFVTVTPLLIPTGEAVSTSNVEPVGGVVRESSVDSVANAV